MKVQKHIRYENDPYIVGQCKGKTSIVLGCDKSSITEAIKLKCRMFETGVPMITCEGLVTPPVSLEYKGN
eukprot:UN34702